MTDGLTGNSSDSSIPAVLGTQTGVDGTGVFGVSDGVGVFGQSTGIHGFSGVHGESVGGAGVSGTSVGSVGIDAKTQTGPAAVRAISAGNGPGVLGSSLRVGVFGKSTGNEGFSGVHGESDGGPGVSGTSVGSVGVDAKTQTGPAAVRAVHAGGGLAGLFEGDVEITGHILHHGDFDCHGDMRFPNADCAEEFDVADGLLIEPGTVMVLDCNGALAASQHAYDKRVAGVVSGGGDYKPGIVLDKRDTGVLRQPIALLGKVFCKVDAQFGAIAVGDLLTTSPTPGHAMMTS